MSESNRLAAAREVASHMYLEESGFAFAPHPMLAETDRDKFAVHQIIDFYHAQNTDYADYFQTAWKFKHRAALGKPGATLETLAREAKVSPEYLPMVWSLLEETTEDDLDQILAVNVKGVFLGTKHALPAMRRAGGGSIIFFRLKILH